MYKMIIQVTQSFETIEECEEEYVEISGELRRHPNLHINCQIVTKKTAYNPTYPNGHEVEP